MLNESKNQALHYIQNDEILYIPHFFYEWDSETKKMSRIERDIFLDLRTMYFGNATANNGKIDAKDKELLCYQLGCNTDEEKQSLERLLQAKFKKVGNTYRHAKWDKQIKNIKWAMKNSKHGNAGNEQGNDDSNAMSNAERQKKLKAERKKLLADLQSIGIVVDKDVAMATLRETHAKYFSDMDNGLNNENNNTNGNAGNEQSNDDGNESNDQKRANNQHQDNNYYQQQESVQKSENSIKPHTLATFENLTNEKTSQLTNGFADDEILTIANNFTMSAINSKSIKYWQAPSFESMQELLTQEKYIGLFNQESYNLCVTKFKNYWANLEIQGKPLITQELRVQKLIDWIKRERPNQAISDTTQATPELDKKLDPQKTVMLNGLPFEVFPNMTAKQTWYFVQSNIVAYEGSDDTYKRLTHSIDWQNFDYQSFYQEFEKAVA